MKAKDSSYQMIVRLMFRLLPIQILLTVIEDPVKNIGVRLVYNMAKNVQYQSVLGLNVLTITI